MTSSVCGFRNKGTRIEGVGYPFGNVLEAINMGAQADGNLCSLHPFLACLGRLPRTGETAGEIVSVTRSGNTVLEQVVLTGDFGYRIPGVLAYAEENRNSVGVIAIHGHGGNYEQGKEKIFKTRSGNPTYGYGLRLVEAGFVVFAIDLLGFGERQVKPVADRTPWVQDMERFIFCTLLLHGATLAGIHLFDLSSAVDYMASRSDIVDPDRIGVIGHSMGGTLSPLLMLFDERLKSGVSAAGLSTWRAMIDHQVIHNFGVYLPGVLNYCDMDDLCARIAPRPFMMIAGKNDLNFPIIGIPQSFQQVLAKSKTKDIARTYEAIVHDGGHAFEIVHQDCAIEFFSCRL